MESSGTTEFVSIGEWIQRRRNAMGMTRADLARRVGCAEVTIKKIERDERKPSGQIAELLAEHLAIPDLQREKFLQMCRGSHVTAPGLRVNELRYSSLPATGRVSIANALPLCPAKSRVRSAKIIP